MSQIFKFRAWDKDLKRFRRIIQLIFLAGELKQILVGDGNQIPIKLNLSEFELMQFTGLLDKNGVEIYEGDILVCREMHDSNLDYWQNNEAVPFEVSWCETGWVIPSRDELLNFEIIGNIYEHPHLLEKP